MFIKLLYVNLIFLFFVSIANSSTNIFIYATIDDKIITNLDIQKEGEYLKTLNPNLIQLDDDKVFNLAKDSLINEVIKINEIEKFVNISEDHALVEQYLKNLYSKLNFNNEKNFNDYLLTKKHYSLDEIKQKLKIEILWNELIFSRFSNQVRIDKNAFIKKIKNRKNDTKKEYLLSVTVKKDLLIQALHH